MYKRQGKDKFSKTYKFSDINYAVASREDKEAMFLEYSELLNSLDSGAVSYTHLIIMRFLSGRTKQGRPNMPLTVV